MKKRTCKYCKLEIPRDATVCGHCTRDNPTATKQKYCSIHKNNYDVEYDVKKQTFASTNCPLCEHDDKLNKERETRKKDQQRSLYKREIAPLVKRLENYVKAKEEYELEKKYSPFGNNGFDNGSLSGRILYVSGQLFLVFPIAASIVGGLVSSLAGLDSYFHGIGLVYIILMYFYTIVPVKNWLSKKYNYLKQDKMAEPIRAEIRNIEKKYEQH